MKSLAEYQAAVDEIREVCRRHGVILMPLDDGAILLCDSSDPSNEPEETDNLCERQDDESAFITGIGDVPKAGER